MRGLGAKRDDHTRRTQRQARDFLHVCHAGNPMPSAWSLEAFEAPILGQGDTSSCTAHGTAQILTINANVTGSPLGFLPSPRAIYAVTRSIERLGDLSQPLTDSGAYPGDVMKAISQWGVSPCASAPASDVTSANVNNEIDLMSLEEGAVNLVAPEYRIDEYASDIELQVQQAIRAGYAVGISFFADLAFMQYTAGAPPVGAPNQAGPGGGHWTVLSSFRTAADGSKIYRGPGSWGASYGDAGHHEVNGAFLRSVWDCYTGPTPRRAA